MTVKISAAKTLAVLFATVAVIATSVAVSPADAAPAKKKKTVIHDRDAVYGARGPNVVYQQGRTRVYITRRSWLDAGVEVQPGDRKFTDYAYPPGYSFARDNNNRSTDRQPLNSQWDLGGFPASIPLY